MVSRRSSSSSSNLQGERMPLEGSVNTKDSGQRLYLTALSLGQGVCEEGPELISKSCQCASGL